MKTIERQIIEKYIEIIKVLNETLIIINADKKLHQRINEMDDQINPKYLEVAKLTSELATLKSQLKDEEQPITDRLKAQKAQPGDEEINTGSVFDSYHNPTTLPAECRECGHQNSENCNTCDILHPQFR